MSARHTVSYRWPGGWLSPVWRAELTRRQDCRESNMVAGTCNPGTWATKTEKKSLWIKARMGCSMSTRQARGYKMSLCLKKTRKYESPPSGQVYSFPVRSPKGSTFYHQLLQPTPSSECTKKQLSRLSGLQWCIQIRITLHFPNTNSMKSKWRSNVNNLNRQNSQSWQNKEKKGKKNQTEEDIRSNFHI